ncbi:MAG: PEP-CTERM sorting domain-containing protein [Moraxellaceae bacterium]|nr:MAG: PEP-CTERM sorting domain-containing protein [Moraxellaceae bacterium]
MKLLGKFGSFVIAAFFSATAFAHPIAAVGTEGLSVIASGGEVIAKYEGNSASFSNDLYLNLNFIFNNQATPVGSTVNLGTFTAGTELVFRLYVNNTGESWFTGAASRNNDGLFHARVQENWKPGTTLVSFEDLSGDPEGVNGFNDLSFSFTNTQTTPVPESSALVLMLIGLGLLGFARRKNV